ncbi:hypothetical protein LZ30DRAFT_283625 [Colletotrichum cereale]|nr:hypothetical protein LZ30DRAFT_283625 [Colletotrichum cereale]
MPLVGRKINAKCVICVVYALRILRGTHPFVENWAWSQGRPLCCRKYGPSESLHPRNPSVRHCDVVYIHTPSVLSGDAFNIRSS